MNEQEQNKPPSVREEKKGTINAQVQNVFPLACPVMEYKWIPGWKCELIHCPNGHVELGTIFNEIFSAPVLADSIAQTTTWTAVLYEPDRYRIHYRLDNKISSSLYKIEFEADLSGRTKYRIELTYSPLNEKGRHNMEKDGVKKIQLMLSVLSLMLKHYCERGEMIKSSEIMKLGLRFKQITVKARIRLLLNQWVMRVAKDEDRKRFQKGLPIIKVKST